MKKKTNKILWIAAAVVVLLNLAIIGTGLVMAAHNAEPAAPDSTTAITFWSDDDDITAITDESDTCVSVITINPDGEGEE